MRFGIVGCGRILGKHIDAIRSVKGCQIGAVCDSRAARARQTGKKLGVPHYSRIGDMLKKEKLDICSVLTPTHLHPEHAIEVAESGRHVIVEKPMALQLDAADRMIETCDRHGVGLYVVKQNRYNVAVQYLKKALDEGRFGKLVMGTVRVRWCRRADYYAADDWRGKWATDGGVISNQASHHVDLIQWLMGPVDSVFALGATQLVDIEVEDTAVAVLKFSNGALGTFEATTATRPRDLEGSVSVLGEKGSVVIGGFAVNKIETWEFEKPLPADKKMKETGENPPNVYGFGHIAFYQDLIDTIRKGGRALVDGLEGRKSLELILALYESMETGKEIPLRFNPKLCRLGKVQRTEVRG